MSDKDRRSIPCEKPAKQDGAGSGPNWRTQRLQFGPSLLRLLLPGSAVLLVGCSDKSQNFLTPSGPVPALEYHHLWLITLVTR
jgi:hypothetical protein